MSKGQPREGGAAMSDSGWKAASALGSAQEPGRGPATHPISCRKRPPGPLTPVQNSVASHAKFHLGT